MDELVMRLKEQFSADKDTLEDLRTLEESQVLELWPQLTHDDLYRHRSNGNLRAIKSGRKVLYPMLELKRFIKENLGKHVSTTPPTKEERIRLRKKTPKQQSRP
jgi:hypothetical protein